MLSSIESIKTGKVFLKKVINDLRTEHHPFLPNNHENKVGVIIRPGHVDPYSKNIVGTEG